MGGIFINSLNLAEPCHIVKDSRDNTPEDYEEIHEEEQTSDRPSGPRLWGGGMVESSLSYSVPGATYFFHNRNGLSYEERENTRSDSSVTDDEIPRSVLAAKPKRAPSPRFEMSKDLMDNIGRMIEKLKNREPSEGFSMHLKWDLEKIAQQIRGPNGSFKGYKSTFQNTNFMFVNSRRDELLPAVTEMVDQFDSKVTDITRRIEYSGDRLGALMEAQDLLSVHLKDWQKLVSDCKDLFTRERNAKKAQKAQQEADEKLLSVNSAPGPETSGEGTVTAGTKRKQFADGEANNGLKGLAEKEGSRNKKNRNGTTRQTRSSNISYK
jgi:hypothetical protein